jgi:hypothetical protein
MIEIRIINNILAILCAAFLVTIIDCVFGILDIRNKHIANLIKIEKALVIVFIGIKVVTL